MHAFDTTEVILYEREEWSDEFAFFVRRQESMFKVIPCPSHFILPHEWRCHLGDGRYLQSGTFYQPDHNTFWGNLVVNKDEFDYFHKVIKPHDAPLQAHLLYPFIKKHL